MQAFEMIDGGDKNAYHLFFLMIANFSIADWENRLIVYYYPRSDSKLAEGMLSLLPPNFIRHTEKHPEIEYKTFLHAIPFYGDIAPTESYHLLRNLYKRWIQPCRGTSIYIQRRSSPRRVVNEVELLPVLKEFGYEVVALEDYPVVDQIRIVSEAKNILAPHGAGLAFTVFCNPEARIIELSGDSNLEQRHYMHLAYALGLRFHRYPVKESGGDLWVRCDELEWLLRRWNL
jgi:hypothetical protein